MLEEIRKIIKKYTKEHGKHCNSRRRGVCDCDCKYLRDILEDLQELGATQERMPVE